jgi:hypothetical protein
MPNEIGGDRGKNSDREHAAPADDWQQDRRHDGGGEHAKLPSQPDIGRHPRPLRRRPCFGDQRHADAKFAAKPDAGHGAVDQKIPVTLGEGAHAGKDREQHDGPGQYTDAADAVRQHAKDDTADHGADQGGGDQGSALRRTKSEIRRNNAQHEPEDQEIEPVHRITQCGSQQRLAGFVFLGRRKIAFQDGAVGSALKMAHDDPLSQR